MRGEGLLPASFSNHSSWQNGLQVSRAKFTQPKCQQMQLAWICRRGRGSWGWKETFVARKEDVLSIPTQPVHAWAKANLLLPNIVQITTTDLGRAADTRKICTQGCTQGREFIWRPDIFCWTFCIVKWSCRLFPKDAKHPKFTCSSLGVTSAHYFSGHLCQDKNSTLHSSQLVTWKWNEKCLEWNHRLNTGTQQWDTGTTPLRFDSFYKSWVRLLKEPKGFRHIGPGLSHL